MASSFHRELEKAVLERHCANHPMTEKWAKGELGRDAMMGWGVEHRHWVTKMKATNFTICSKAPDDAIASELENFRDENDPDRPHKSIVLRFAEASGADLDEVRAGRGLPTTRSWVGWLTKTARANPWYCGVAAIRVGTESQSPMLYSKVRRRCARSTSSTTRTLSMVNAAISCWKSTARRARCRRRPSILHAKARACGGSISTASSSTTKWAIRWHSPRGAITGMAPNI